MMPPIIIILITAVIFGFLGFAIGIYMCRENEQQAHEDGRALGWLDGYKAGRKDENAYHLHVVKRK